MMGQFVSCGSWLFLQPRLVPRKLARYTFLSTNMCGVHTRASPSGKASASQADTRGFESRCPLQEFEGTSNGAFCMCGPRARTRTRWGREAEQTRERLPASVRGCEASEAADSRSEYASPVARSRIVEGASDGAFAIYGFRELVRIRWGRPLKKYLISARDSRFARYTAVRAQQKPSWRPCASRVYSPNSAVGAEMT